MSDAAPTREALRPDPLRPRPPLRLWPGVAAVALQWAVWQGSALVLSGMAAGYAAVLGLAVGGLGVVVWWAFFSRAPLSERVGALALLVAVPVATSPFLHPSVAGGMMGLMFAIYVIPVASLAFVAWAVAARRLAGWPRWATLAGALVLACGAFILLRVDGITGDGEAQFAWRWTPTPEERLLALGAEPAEAAPADPWTAEEAAWPGFRGAGRDGDVPGVRIATDWAASPPVELWRRPVGPGWSSFAVAGELLFTQEQRGEDEVVAAYELATGEPVWRHRDATRFWEANAGAGPRATPTFHDGRIHTLGATGLLNVLEAADGAVVWSRDAASDTGAETPYWGFSGSPAVIGELVVVAASGRLVAYERATGELRWLGPEGGASYSSPQPATLDGVPQVVQMSAAGAVGVAAADGETLWEHPWEGYPIVQPAIAGDGALLISADQEGGTRRLAVHRGAGVWRVDERWTSRGLKPYFNDFVLHGGHAYGFDGRILAAIDLADGERRWKGGRYGHGQLVLLPDQDLLLVLSEEGEVALVEARPEAFSELARFPALEGKTWNHPVLAGDVLLVRNGREMAAFRLAPADARPDPRTRAAQDPAAPSR